LSSLIISRIILWRIGACSKDSHINTALVLSTVSIALWRCIWNVLDCNIVVCNWAIVIPGLGKCIGYINTRCIFQCGCSRAWEWFCCVCSICTIGWLWWVRCGICQEWVSYTATVRSTWSIAWSFSKVKILISNILSSAATIPVPRFGCSVGCVNTWTWVGSSVIACCCLIVTSSWVVTSSRISGCQHSVCNTAIIWRSWSFARCTCQVEILVSSILWGATTIPIPRFSCGISCVYTRAWGIGVAIGASCLSIVSSWVCSGITCSVYECSIGNTAVIWWAWSWARSVTQCQILVCRVLISAWAIPLPCLCDGVSNIYARAAWVCWIFVACDCCCWLISSSRCICSNKSTVWNTTCLWRSWSCAGSTCLVQVLISSIFVCAWAVVVPRFLISWSGINTRAWGICSTWRASCLCWCCSVSSCVSSGKCWIWNTAVVWCTRWFTWGTCNV